MKRVLSTIVTTLVVVSFAGMVWAADTTGTGTGSYGGPGTGMSTGAQSDQGTAETTQTKTKKTKKKRKKSGKKSKKHTRRNTGTGASGMEPNYGTPATGGPSGTMGTGGAGTGGTGGAWAPEPGSPGGLDAKRSAVTGAIGAAPQGAAFFVAPVLPVARGSGSDPVAIALRRPVVMVYPGVGDLPHLFAPLLGTAGKAPGPSPRRRS